jgi:Capsule assembly protein Wzi/PAP2 superfamily
LIVSWLKVAVSQIVILVLAMMASAVAQTITSGLPSASTEKPDTRTVADSSSVKTKTPEDPYELQPGEDPENRLGSPFLKHVVGDQEQFWTSPARFRTKDLKWMLPAVGITAAFIASDSWWSRQVNPNHVQTSLHISDYTTYSLIGLGGASFLFGSMTHDGHLQEAGLLSGEAAINSTGVTYLFKEITQRQRPFQGNGNGDFFTGGSSFFSEHSAIAWSIASVWAHEYPGWLSQLAAYGLASTVTITRVTAKQHFPSDVIVGSALGWYFGRQVYRAHHDPEIGGSPWGSLFEEKTGDKVRDPAYMASPYVPLDSWIYPLLERLIALGYMRSNMLGIRPWTRLQCARMVEETGEKLGNADDSAEVAGIYKSLAQEFAPEIARLEGAANVGAEVKSVYTRMTGISGTPVRDSYHFGQTLINDYGRPYWTGFNDITGVSAEAEAGPLAFNLQAEYQHAPAMPSYSAEALSAIGAADLTPPSANGTSQVNQVQLLNSTVSLNVANVQFSFGEQSAWLGTGESGSFLMSNNAAPFPMVKIDDVQPHDIPGLSRILGPFRAEFFIGQLSGHHWETCLVASCQTYPGYPNVVGPNIVPQPFIQGSKISFQPTPNFEFGMGYTAMFGGPGLPVTFANFFRTFYVHSSNAANNPGKRISEADFSYRIPGLRNWLTVYLDSLVTDEFSPIGSTRANVNPGIFMPRIPKIPKLELRAEGFNVSRTTEFSPGFVYSDNRRFLGGYTNDGVLMGSWIGRAGRGGQGWLTYWLSPRNKIQLSYRLQGVSPDFIEGGRMVDYSAQTEFMIGPNVAVSGFFQYEQWKFPVLTPTGQSDITASLQLTFYPHWHAH